MNLPITFIGFVVAIISGLGRISFNVEHLAFVFNVKKFWWVFGYMKNARAMTIGTTILLGPNLEVNDLEHELIHVDQYNRAPLVHIFLYYVELFKKGYINNKYEIEAYKKAGNIYKS